MAVHLVVDSGAFIRNAPLRDIGDNIYSIRDVINEIRDKATRERLQVLPYQINFQEPQTEAIKRVTEFSKKTGDYASLSAVDIRLMALACQLEQQHVGLAHIKDVPDQKITWTSTRNHLEKPTEIAGFYLSHKKPSSNAPVPDDSSEGTAAVGDTLEGAIGEPKAATDADEVSSGLKQVDIGAEAAQLSTGDTSGAHSETSGTIVQIETSATPAPGPPCSRVDGPGDSAEAATDASGQRPSSEDGQIGGTVSGDCARSEACGVEDGAGGEAGAGAVPRDPSRLPREGDVIPGADLQEEEEEAGGSGEDWDSGCEGGAEEQEEEEDEDNDGWITPSNISQVKMSMGEPSREKAQVVVGCITTDFAMQNVLIQMGLNVVSVDGMLIKRAKSYVLRCFACFKLSNDVTRVFCHHCGNKTLQKVSMSVADDGSIQYFLSKRKPPTTRGLRFSLPKPQGGKHAKNPILCEDQPGARQCTSSRAKVKYNALDPDYVTFTSPFAPVDTHSRSAQLGIRDHKHGFRSKRNPNENNKVYGRRK